jgi:hypothetical protein
MAKDGIAPEEFATWLTPSETIKLLAGVLSADVVVSTLIGRLHGGIIQAYAESSSLEEGGRVKSFPSIVLIPPRYWGHFTSNTINVKRFAEVGDVRFILGDGNHTRRETTIFIYLGLRLDPTGVRAMLPPTPPQPREEPAQTPPPAAPVEEVEAELPPRYPRPACLRCASQGVARALSASLPRSGGHVGDGL